MHHIYTTNLNISQPQLISNHIYTSNTNKQTQKVHFISLTNKKTMAAVRLLRMSKPLGLGFCKEGSSNFDSYKRRTVTCIGSDERKPAVGVKAAGGSACVVVIEPKTDKGTGLNLTADRVSYFMFRLMKFIGKKRQWGLYIQMYVEKVIFDCRFFTLLAIAGSLLGSVLCFVEGCVLIITSYFQSFALARQSDQGNAMLHLIESIDMFLIGTAMLTFGMALHVMFVGSQNSHFRSSSSTNFNFQRLQSWMGMESVMQAKSKIGHSVIMILQVEVMEKFKSVPMTNGLDLACLAGVVFLTSASIFLLSRIGVGRAEAV